MLQHRVPVAAFFKLCILRTCTSSKVWKRLILTSRSRNAIDDGTLTACSTFWFYYITYCIATVCYNEKVEPKLSRGGGNFIIYFALSEPKLARRFHYVLKHFLSRCQASLMALETLSNDERFWLKWLFRAVTSYLKDLSLRAAGTRRFHRTSYVCPPMVLNNTGTCFAAGTSFADKKSSTLSIYVRGNWLCLQMKLGYHPDSRCTSHLGESGSHLHHQCSIRRLATTNHWTDTG